MALSVWAGETNGRAVAKLPHFITHMDKQALRAVGVVVAMFVLVAVMIGFGKASMGLEDGEYSRWFTAFSDSSWAVPIVILTYVFAAFLGVPQWAMIAGTIVAFGPMAGGIYAWVATMISASVDFWLGRWVGAERLKRFGGDLVNRIIGVVRRNGFVTSFAIRLVPTGPFVLVNMAAGVSRMKFQAFLGGTALGIIPKIVIVGLLTQGILSGAQGDVLKLGFVGLAAVFIGVMLVARRRLKKHVLLDEETAKKPIE